MLNQHHLAAGARQLARFCAHSERTRLSATYVAALTAILALSACGGGDTVHDHAIQVTTEQGRTTMEEKFAAHVYSTEEGSMLELSGVTYEEVAAIFINGTDFIPLIRQMVESAQWTASDIDGSLFIASNRQLAEAGLPSAGEVVIVTSTGRSISIRLSDASATPAVVASGVADRAQALGIDWNKLLKAALGKAKKMAVKGIVHSVIVKWMERQGFICPINKWWACARPAE